MKKALIIGASGQDGSFLTQFLTQKNYNLICSTRTLNKNKFINHRKLSIDNNNINYVELDILEINSIINLIRKYQPNEIYNLSAQSSVSISFEKPHETINSIVNATLNLLEAIKLVNPEIRFYSAGSSESFGDHGDYRIDEKSSLKPVSPYGIAKASASMLVRSYRNSYNMNCCTGYLFNHESVLRPKNFVTKKIVKSAVDIYNKKAEVLELGNINISRDWGWAPDYVEAMWLMLQNKNIDDYIIGTGKSNSLKTFIRLVFEKLDIDYKKHIKINKKYFRPSEILVNKCNPEKAKRKLGWNSSKSLDEIIKLMLDHELSKKN